MPNINAKIHHFMSFGFVCLCFFWVTEEKLVVGELFLTMFEKVN